MKRITLALAIFFVAGLSTINAQVGQQQDGIYSNSKVYVSIEQPVRGQAKESKTILIDPKIGSYAYQVVDNYPNKFESKKIKLTSYKKVGEKYQKINSEHYDIDEGYTYTYLKYSFTDVGDYAFDVHDGNGKFINSGYVKAESKGAGTADFSKSKVYVSVDIPVAGVAKESKSIVINKKQGSYAYVVLDNYPNNLNINTINLRVYRKVKGKMSLIDNKNYTVNGDNFFTYIKYSFFKSGEYSFFIRDPKGELIDLTTVTVKYK